ncbi:MAG: hypothetical protein M3T55_13355 [Pseudomonadota bacterium]|nr:hypothetical protein [Pseudomonadota bacterium]
MTMELDHNQVAALRAYAAGQIGTRQALEGARLRDYADLIVALARTGLDFPKPAATPAHEAHVARARDILQPRLRHGG